MLQAIIFDFDGIIADSEPAHFQATNDALAPLGVLLDFQTFLRECVGQADLSNFKRLCAKYQINPDEQLIQKLLDAKIDAYRQMLKTHVRACHGAIPLIKNAAQHFPLAICSGSYKSEIAQLLTVLDGEDLTPYFKHLVSIEDVPEGGKPDPAGYRLTANLLNTLPEFCLAIEDSPAGIIAAKTAGMTVLAVTTTHPREKLSLADHCIDSLAEITLTDLVSISAAKV